jgi:hypothetical protein
MRRTAISVDDPTELAKITAGDTPSDSKLTLKLVPRTVLEDPVLCRFEALTGGLAKKILLKQSVQERSWRVNDGKLRLWISGEKPWSY